MGAAARAACSRPSALRGADGSVSWSSALRLRWDWFSCSSTRWWRNWSLRRRASSARNSSCLKTSSVSSTRALKNSLDGNPNVSRQLHCPRDHLQDRLLRTGPVWKDDELTVRLWTGARGSARTDGVFGYPDRPHPLLRLSPSRAGFDLRIRDQVPALYRARSELLQRHSQAGAAGRRWSGVRGGQPSPTV